MRITNLSEQILLKLYSTYNYNNIIRRNWDGARYPYYFIPIELVIDLKSFKKYCYEITDKGGWLCSNKVSIALPKLCGITPQIYYDLLVLHINDSNLRPKCPNCSKYLEWQGRIIRGYNSSSQNQLNHYCSRSCELTYIWNHPKEYGELGNHLLSGSGFSKAANKNKFIKFMNLGDPYDLVDFYIATTFDNKFKYGVSDNAYSQGWHDDYKKRKILIHAERYKVACIEFDISEDLNTKTEYLDFNISSILKFINSYIKICNKHQV